MPGAGKALRTITADIAEGVSASNKMTGEGSQAGCLSMSGSDIYIYDDVAPQH